MKPETRATHQIQVKMAADNAPLVGPLYQSVKFSFETVGELRRFFARERDGFFYSRGSNPTIRQLELLLAELQGREAALITTSGMSALSTAVFGLVSGGDHLVMFYESYKPTRALVRNLLKRFGVTATILSIRDLEQLESKIIPGKTKLILFESPTNPLTHLADMEKITAVAQKHGVLTLLDNTFAGFHNHGQYPVDLFVHSLTKYASGHGDVMGGAIIGNQSLIQQIDSHSHEVGANIDPHAAYLILRGMKTYFIRYQHQCSNAQKIAEFLDQDPHVSRVFYPGLKTHPQHALACKQMSDFGTIVSCNLVGSDPYAVDRFIDQLKLFKLAASLGSTESLVAPVDLFFGGDLTQEEKNHAEIAPTGVRLSIGIEHAEDLIADLKQALLSIDDHG